MNKKDLVSLLGNIADEYDESGKHVVANTLTRIMNKVAQAPTIEQRGALFNSAQTPEIQRVLQQATAKGINDDDVLYYWAKGLYDANFANNLIAFKKTQGGKAQAQSTQSAPSPATASTAGLALDPIAPVTASRKGTFKSAQAQLPNLSALISGAQAIQNSTLKQPMDDFNTRYTSSLGGGNVQALGELSLAYNKLATAVSGCASQISGLFNANKGLLDKLPLNTKITVVTNIFAPIDKIISTAKNIRINKIDPNLSGPFAGSAGTNLEAGDATFNSVKEIEDDIINQYSGQPSTPAPQTPQPQPSSPHANGIGPNVGQIAPLME